jgi:AraC family transcriptional regulator of adaptative response/methylated-DNA-[protein]-cysteine methyltransferase
VYCRPSCPSRRPASVDNVQFYKSPDEASAAGFRACLRCQPQRESLQAVKQICRYLEANSDRNVPLAELSSQFRLSPAHLQKTFKAVTGISPRKYVDACRLERFRDQLQRCGDVTRAIYDAGFGSSSRVYERTGEFGMTPGIYRRGGAGMHIRYGIAASPLGIMLVGATEKGVCSISFGETEEELESLLRAEFSQAEIVRDEAALADWLQTLVRHLEGETPDARLPLDIRATAFQKKVWDFLQTIPYGETMSYSQIAAQIGNPKATRAVASACARNAVAIAIPCHRVIKDDGGLGGYRWGLHRKRVLLDNEKRHAGTPA